MRYSTVANTVRFWQTPSVCPSVTIARHQARNGSSRVRRSTLLTSVWHDKSNRVTIPEIRYFLEVGSQNRGTADKNLSTVVWSFLGVGYCGVPWLLEDPSLGYWTFVNLPDDISQYSLDQKCRWDVDVTAFQEWVRMICLRQLSLRGQRIIDSNDCLFNWIFYFN